MRLIYFFFIPYLLITGCTKPNETHSVAASVSPYDLSFKRPVITMDQFMGTNAFVDDPVDKMQAVGFIREYHNWNWDEGDIWANGGNKAYKGFPHNEMKWAPSEAGGGGWNFDRYYKLLRDSGLTISPCIQGSVAWLHGGTDFPKEDKPVDEPGADPSLPTSYEKKAHHMFQFAARFGSTIVNDDKLTLAANQPRVSGLGVIEYLEDWNEQDKDWLGPGAEFSPEEYAAMLSANYDGHCNTLKGGSNTFGIKNADPKMKVVMGGLAGLDLNYIKDMKRWFEERRADKRFAADVINVHDYAWRSACGPCDGPAGSPEEHGFKEKLEEIVKYRNEHLPNMEVWISEFGWDTHPDSHLTVPLIDNFDREEVQGQWIVRAYLAFASAGVDRAMQYMLRDVIPQSSLHFSSSGLVGPKGNWTPKKSWYYVYTMKNTLAGMRFIGEEQSADKNILIYKFKSINSDSGAYAVWAKTTENYSLNYSLPVKHATSATLVELVPGKIKGIQTPLSITNAVVSVPVTERPIFVKVDVIQ